MEVTTQVGRDHPVDLKRVVSDADGLVTYEHLLTFVPVEFRGGTVKFCFVGRSDVAIVREGARNRQPPESSPLEYRWRFHRTRRSSRGC